MSGTALQETRKRKTRKAHPKKEIVGGGVTQIANFANKKKGIKRAKKREEEEEEEEEKEKEKDQKEGPKEKERKKKDIKTRRRITTVEKGAKIKNKKNRKETIVKKGKNKKEKQKRHQEDGTLNGSK